MVKVFIYFVVAWLVGFLLLWPYKKWCETLMRQKEKDLDVL